MSEAQRTAQSVDPTVPGAAPAADENLLHHCRQPAEEGEEPGERYHLLREDAFDHVTDFTWLRDCKVFDEIEQMILNSIAGGNNRNKWRNRLVRRWYIMTFLMYDTN
jgi:hypothetical protein